MEVRLLSYNSTGFNGVKGNFLNFLGASLNIDIFCLQEHFHLRQNVSKVQNELLNYDSFILPATKSCDRVSTGRPSGGLCIFWKRSLNNCIKIIKHPNSTRVQAIDFQGKYLIINTYFPTDPRTPNFDDFILLKCLEDIKWYLDSHPNYTPIVVGDLNADFSRNTRFVNVVRDFMRVYNLVTVWSSYFADFTFSQSQVRNGNNILSFSLIDHFLIRSPDLNMINNAQVLHLGDNLSSHDPIYLSLNANRVQTVDCDKCDSVNNKPPGPAWWKATDEQLHNYRSDLQSMLINFPLNDGILCSNPNCTDPTHRNDIDNYCKHLLHSIDSAVNVNIPDVSSRQNVKPGWADYVKPYQEDARFWHAVWVSMNRPINCELHNVMKMTRNKYRYAVRRLKKISSDVKQDKMLNSFLDGKANNLIKELKSQRVSKVPKVASSIDGHGNKSNISNHFAAKYEALFNTNVSSDLNNLLDNINADINNLDDVERVSPEIVFQAINNISNRKSDNMYCFKSDAILNASDLLTDYFTILIQSFLIHGYVPNELLSCSLKPIVKDKLGDKCSSDNYRAIGISSLILKVVDWVILILYGTQLKPSQLQFGFQKKNSTSMCSWTVIETINYFNNRDTPVFTCFLDISKAFDLVNFEKLFTKLIDRISPIFIRLLSYIYMHQICCMQWDGIKSKEFKVQCGVRQGAVLSPILFSVYIDDLFTILTESGLGCFINNYYYGLLGYADDLVLLSPSRIGLQRMVDITHDFLDSLGLKISVNHVDISKSKTKCVAFGLKRDPPAIFLCNTPLPWCDKYVHLGHTLYKDGSLDYDCDNKRKAFIGEFHALRQELKCQNPVIYMNLINIYFSHFYGSNLWNLFQNDTIYVSWNNIVRNVFNLPRPTHRYFIESVSDQPHLQTVLTNRFIKFYRNLYCSGKPLIRNLLQIQERDRRSNFGFNCGKLCLINNTLNPLCWKRNAVKYKVVADADVWRLPCLFELLDLRDNYSDNLLPNFNLAEISDMIHYIACY